MFNLFHLFLNLLKAHPAYAHLFPEMLLIGTAFLIIIFDWFLPEGKKISLALLALAGNFAAFAFTLLPLLPMTQSAEAEKLWYGMLIFDAYTRVFKLLVFATLFIVVFSSMHYRPLKKYVGEYYAILLILGTALTFVSSASNLIMIYLSIEFVGISCYILTAYAKDNPRSLEGAIKYLLIGAISSAFLIYGMSLLYGLTGSLDIMDIPNLVEKVTHTPDKLLFISMVFILVGFGFKVAMVPFHMWCPDAYEGAPTPIAAFISVGPKVAGMAVIARVFLFTFSNNTEDWIKLIELLAILSMTLGNVVALWQTNLKRLLAYSSIAHLGYILMGLVVAGRYGFTGIGQEGIMSMTLYLIAYLFMNLGAFAVIILAYNTLESDDIEHYKGLSRRAPLLALAMSVFLLSLAGLPPTVGFIGKFFLFKAAIEGNFIFLTIVALINSVISLYYYWNIVRYMYILEPTEHTPIKYDIFATVSLILMVAAVLGFGLFFNTILSISNTSTLML